MDQCIQVRGVFRAKLFDKDGNLIADLGEFSNRMMTAAMDYLLNGGLRAPPTLVGPYCAVHVGATPPVWGTNDAMTVAAGRESANYAARQGGATLFAASAGGIINFTSPLTFTNSAASGAGSEVVQGVFIVVGTGALSTIANTGGTLFTAGNFPSSQNWQGTNTLQVSYQLQMTSP